MTRSSLRFKLIVLLLIATIAPITASIWVTNAYTKQTVRENALRENSNLLYQGKQNLINYMNSLNETSLIMYKDASFIGLTTSGFDSYSTEAEIFRILQLISRQKDVFQVYMHINERAQGSLNSFLMIQEFLKRGIQANDEALKHIVEMPSDSYEAVMEPTHMSDDYGLTQFPYYAQRTVMTMHRIIYRIPSKTPLGILSIDVKLDTLNQLLKQLGNEGEDLYLIDDKGTLLLSTDQDAAAGAPLQKAWIPSVLGSSEERGSLEAEKGIEIYEKLTTPYLSWYLVKQIPYEHLYQGARDLTRIHMVIIGILLVVVTVLTLLISVRFTRPIKQLLGYIHQIQSGRLDVDIQVDTNDEIGILARRFRMMMQTINDLIKQEYKLNLANKTNQLKALQAQIHPHFLYNSLQSIGTLALQHGAPKVYHLLSALAKMMRYSMNTNETEVSLKQELDHVKAYMQLQLQRFENELEVEYDIEDDTLSLIIPKMLLQPLAENYFKHGFDPRQPHNLLRFRSRRSEDGAFISLIVEDNGKGMPEPELILLREQLDKETAAMKTTEEAHSIGLYNVKSRLRLYYNEDADMQLESAQPHGIRITLRIPLYRPEEETNHESHHRG
ncbi:sensor histidine kinase [Paenibacillus sp. TAB 01]|uniref:cache domain-containing sensor histidine kinase n=1 Tax=Paenibacillus sp. TAB 01 TaxID=3368988 RepID=UPI003751BAEC